MDRIMVISERTKGASESNPIILTRGIDFEYLNIGDEISKLYDSVVMVKEVTVLKPLFSFGSDDAKEEKDSTQEEYVKINKEVFPNNEG